MSEAAEFLYSGANPIQTGVVAGTIEDERASIVRGQVLSSNGTPLSGVTVSVLNHAELGQTISRSDGMLDMAVNGGEPLTIKFQKAGFPPLQRQVDARWQEFGLLPEVVMTPYDANVTAIDLSSPAPVQVARGSVATDEDGSRQATLLFSQGTQAAMTLPNGDTQSLSNLGIRATEYTVGPNGEKAMPASLPATSGYTYAAELSVDQAVSAGAARVDFDRPVSFYVENFLGFPIGLAVPVGYYDHQRGVWVSSPDGKVIKILSETNGNADLDTNGDAQVDDSTILAALEITDVEREQLASLYEPGQGLWRARVTHFSPYDANYPYRAPNGARGPNQRGPRVKGSEDANCKLPGSVISCQSQTLGESLPLAGTPFSLNYRSDRAPGHKAIVEIPLIDSEVPSGLKRIELVIGVAGRQFRQTFSANPDQKHFFVWDGKDSYGRSPQGPQSFDVTIRYWYDAVYRTAAPGGQSFGLPSGGELDIPARAEIPLWRTFRGTLSRLGNLDNRGSSLGGWTLNVHHTYSPTARTLYLGTGEQRRAEGVNRVIDRTAGLTFPNGGDGGLANRAKLFRPREVAEAPDGSVYIADTWNGKIRRVATDGMITKVAGGGGGGGLYGDFGPATTASLERPGGIVVAHDGSFYISDTWHHAVRKVGTDGIIRRVAGTLGSSGYAGDGQPATWGKLCYPQGLALDADGNLYIADSCNRAVRKVSSSGIMSTLVGPTDLPTGPSGLSIAADGSIYIALPASNKILKRASDGTITTVAGTGSWGYGGDDGAATAAQLAQPEDVEVSSEGTLYIGDYGNNRVRKVATDGTISTFGGTGDAGRFGDGGPATQASLDGPAGVEVAADGRVLVADQYNDSVRQVSATGTITTLAGLGSYTGDGGSALDAKLYFPEGVATGPDGSIYIAETGAHRIRKIDTAGVISTFAGNGIYGFSGDGGQATGARLAYPTGVAVASDGSVYLADQDNHRIRKVSTSGVITTAAGNGIGGFAGDGGVATQAKLYYPTSVAFGPDRSMFIADYSNYRVRRVGTDGRITTYAGDGSASGLGEGGQAAQAGIGAPFGLTVAPNGVVYLSDEDYFRVRAVGIDGVIQTVAGNGQCCDSGEGVLATQSSLGYLANLSVGPDGTIYFVDDSQRIRAVTPDGLIVSVAGVIYGGGNGDDDYGDGGFALQANLGSHPYGVAIGPDGSIYIGDSSNDRIRRVAPVFTGLSEGETIIPSQDGGQLYVFDSKGRHKRTLEALTNAVLLQFSYDSSGRLSGVEDGEGNATIVERDASGNPTAMVAPLGQRTEMSLDANGFLASLTNPANETVGLTNSSEGLLATLTTPRNHIYRFTYDLDGRLIKDEDPAGGFTQLERSELPDGYVVTATSAEGRVTTYRTERLASGDNRSRTIDPLAGQSEVIISSDGTQRATSPDGTVTTTEFGPDPRWGVQVPVTTRVTVITPSNRWSSMYAERTATLSVPGDPLSLLTQTDKVIVNNQTSTQTYNASTRTLTATSPVGRTSTTTLDAKGRISASQPGTLEQVVYTYDSRGRLSTLTEGAGATARTTTFAYNAQGFVASVSDPLERVTSYIYDAMGRVVRETLPADREVSYDYDPSGNVATLAPPDRANHELEHDSRGLRSGYTPPDDPVPLASTTYSYNLDSQTTLLDRPGDRDVSFSYDSTGRVASETINRGNIGYSYKPATNLIQTITAPDGGTVSYSYDGKLLLQYALTGGVSGTLTFGYRNGDLRINSRSVNGAAISFSYDNDGLTSQAGALTLARNGNGQVTTGTVGSVVTSRSYDGFGDLASERTVHGSTELINRVYERDKLARITKVTETISGETHVFDYLYNSAGRLQEVKKDATSTAVYSHDKNGNRISVTRTGDNDEGSYDAQDRMLSYDGATYTYTPDGQLLTKSDGSGITTYNYDSKGSLVSVSLPDGTNIEYVLDGAGRRVGRKINGSLGQGFLYEGGRIVAEVDGAGAVVSRFVYTPAGHPPAYMVKGGVTYRILSDQVGSPRLIVNSSTGVVSQRLDYDEFGRVITDSNPGFQPFGFAGGLYDRQSQLLRFGSRDYEPQTGRWTAKDPVGFGGGDSNLYVYVYADPVNLADPYGLSAATVDLGLNDGDKEFVRELLRTGMNIYQPGSGDIAFNYTTVTCISGNIGAVVGAEASLCIVQSRLQEVGLTFTLGQQYMSPNAGIGGHVGISNACSISDLGGEYGYAGGGGAGFYGDYQWSDEPLSPGTWIVSGGYGKSLAPGGYSGQSNTWTWTAVSL